MNDSCVLSGGCFAERAEGVGTCLAIGWGGIGQDEYQAGGDVAVCFAARPFGISSVTIEGGAAEKGGLRVFAVDADRQGLGGVFFCCEGVEDRNHTGAVAFGGGGCAVSEQPLMLHLGGKPSGAGGKKAMQVGVRDGRSRKKRRKADDRPQFF